MVTTAAAASLAVLVGMSISASVAAAVHLNSRSPSPQAHSVYISLVSTALGTALLIVASLLVVRVPLVRPRRWWTLCGGVCVLPSFATVAASGTVGVQASMVALLVGQLGTALAIDTCIKRSTRVTAWTLVGLGLVYGGVGVNAFAASSSAGVPRFTAASALFLVLCALAGAGYALLALCVAELGKDIGSPLRATCLSGVVLILALLPLAAGTWLCGRLPPTLRPATDWPLWLFVGAQYGAYILAMALLPRVLSYTPLLISSLIGQLVCSTVVDATNLAGAVHVPLTWSRGVALALICCGYAVYQLAAAHSRVLPPAKDDDGAEVEEGGPVKAGVRN
jgi:uncharacterized membrane protein YdcZ (DUF606 family)